MLYSPDGARMYSGGADGGLCVYDVAQVGWGWGYEARAGSITIITMDGDGCSQNSGCVWYAT